MADKATGRGPEPGYLGKPQRTISFPFEDLTEYKRLVDLGLVDLGFPAFVRQAVEHELARYRAEETSRRRSKGK